MPKIKTGIARLLLGASIFAVIGSAFAAPTLNLPPNPPGPYTSNLTFASDFTLGSYFTAVFGTPAIPAGLDVVQGTSYKAWCVEFNDGIVFTGGPTIFTAANAGPFTFRNSLGSLPADAQSPNWGAVNWLLNNKGGNNVIDIQEAIWILLNNSSHSNPFIAAVEPSVPSAATNALVTAALTHNSFVPTAGQIVAVLLDGGDGLANNHTDVQSLIIEVTVPRQFTGCTVTQGGWGAPAHGNNPGTVLNAAFPVVYPAGVTIGSINTLHFTSSNAVRNFLPQGGPPSFLNTSAIDPTARTSAGVFAGQVLALQLNVDIEGLGSLVLSGTGTGLDGDTVAQVLAAANIALGGGGLPAGFASYSSLNDLIDNLNGSFDGCVADGFASSHLH
jgi:hypothetical protein